MAERKFDQISEMVVKMKKDNGSLENVKQLENEVKEEQKKINEQEEKKIDIETKGSDDIMHTTNTNRGQELIPTNVVKDPILNMVVGTSKILPLLPGNHGDNMDISTYVPIIGEASYYEGVSEVTDTPLANQAGPYKKFQTDRVQINQKEYRATHTISYQEARHSVGVLDSLVRTKLVEGMAKTLDFMVINGDTSSSGNINYNGGTASADTTSTPNASLYTTAGGSLRYSALNDSNTVNAGTLASGDILSSLAQLGKYGAENDKLMLLAPSTTYLKMLGLDEVEKLNEFGPNATILSGQLASIYNIPVMKTVETWEKVASDGLRSSTSGNNTLGHAIILYRPAVQYGFGQPPKYWNREIQGRGFEFGGYGEFGFTTAYEEAGLDKTVSVIRNITVS